MSTNAALTTNHLLWKGDHGYGRVYQPRARGTLSTRDRAEQLSTPHDLENRRNGDSQGLERGIYQRDETTHGENREGNFSLTGNRVVGKPASGRVSHFASPWADASSIMSDVFPYKNALSSQQKRGITITVIGVLWWGADHYGRVLTALSVIKGIPHLLHAMQPYATPVIAALGVVWFFLGERIKVWMFPRPVLDRNIEDTPKPTTPSDDGEKPLPELRPKIIAVSYTRLASVPVLGFEIANDGEPAYEVSIPDVKMGTSVVTFEGNCPRMANRSTTEWRVLIKHDTGGFSTGNSLREEMLKQGLHEIAVPIRYKDGNNLWYVSHCRIEVNVSVRNGLAVHTDSQELVSRKQIQDTSSLPPTAPRPYFEVEDPTGAAFGKTIFHFTNRGGDVAHNLQVHPMAINHLSVIFDPIPVLAVNETKTTIPTIPGRGIMQQHDILNLMVKEWEEAWEQRRLATQEEIDEWKTQIIITYQDFAERRFEATADLFVFPLKRTLRDKHVLESPPPEYKTAEVRNIKFRQIP